MARLRSLYLASCVPTEELGQSASVHREPLRWRWRLAPRGDGTTKNSYFETCGGRGDVRLHGGAGDVGVPGSDSGPDDVMIVVAIVEGAGELLDAADRDDEEVGEVPHPLAEVCHQPGVRHPVDDQVIFAIAEAIIARSLLGVIELLEIGDALPCVVELGELGVGSSCGRGGSDLTFETTEEVEEIPDFLRGVGGDPAAALRDDLDDPGGLEPAHGVHDRLLAHPEFRLYFLDRDPGADRV